MMTYEEVMALLETLGEDVSTYTTCEGDLHVTVEDFEGFDEDWEEVERDYDEDAVDAVYEALCEGCASVEGDFYHYLQFEGFILVWGYASFDI